MYLSLQYRLTLCHFTNETPSSLQVKLLHVTTNEFHVIIIVPIRFIKLVFSLICRRRRRRW